LLRARVVAGHRGPLIVLSGVADISTAATLTGVITGQLSEGTRHLVIDVSGLRSADSSSIWLLVVVARTLERAGGSMVLTRPQPAVVNMLAQVDVNQVITIPEETNQRPEPEDSLRANLTKPDKLGISVTSLEKKGLPMAAPAPPGRWQ
jgi:anti-anti-sigma factor